MSDINHAIKKFLASKAFAVAGASSNRGKYGNKVLRVYLQNNMKVYPINPNEKTIEDVNAFSSVKELPEDVKSLSIITPPPITEKIVAAAIEQGIENIWMQPGAESRKAIELCESHKINVIAGGPCILITLHFHEV